MRSAVAPDSRRAQASASLIMTSAMVSVPRDLHSAIKVAQHHVSSLQGDLWEMALDSLWKMGEHGLFESKPPLSHPLQFPLSCLVQGERLSASHLHPMVLDGPFIPGACLPLLVFAGPQEVFKNSGSYISHSSSWNQFRPCCIQNINL